MKNLTDLIITELIKVFYSKKFKFFTILLLVLVLGFAWYKLQEQNQFRNDNWKSTLLAEQQDLQSELNEAIASSPDSQYVAFLKNNLKRNEQLLEQNENPFALSNWKFVTQVEFLVLLCLLFSLIFAVDSITDEYNYKTIRFFVLQPLSRFNLLVSKFVSIILLNFILLALLLTLSFMVGSFLFNHSNPELLIFRNYFLSFLKISVLTSTSFMFAILLKNNILAIFFTFGFYVLLSKMDLSFINILSLQLNLQDLFKSLIIIVLFFAISFMKFNQEEF